jgi:hypothetical protein
MRWRVAGDARPARAADERLPAWIRDEFGDKITDGPHGADEPDDDDDPGRARPAPRIGAV